LKPWFICILRCGDDKLYAGITTDVGRRIEEHNAGKAPGSRYAGSRYTRSRRAVELAYTEEAASRAGRPARAQDQAARPQQQGGAVRLMAG
jgi:predicted GIY-YIG superfamily endonuclease